MRSLNHTQLDVCKPTVHKSGKYLPGFARVLYVVDVSGEGEGVNVGECFLG